MNISQCYKILNIPENAANEVITSSYKKMAMMYHPDRNRDRVEWATEAMTKINTAYAEIMSYRFKNANHNYFKAENAETKKEPAGKTKSKMPYPYDQREEADHDLLVNRFVKLREAAKDAMYQFFQYNLYNLARRDSVSNRAKFNSIIICLRRSYHAIQKLAQETEDRELLDHFNIFSMMIFDFYRASECLNVIDSYSNQYDVDAYRLYKTGDEALHTAHKEIFYDRHNRGKFKRDIAILSLLKAENLFQVTLRSYPRSTWAVETQIKLEYVNSLKEYIHLFFTEETK